MEKIICNPLNLEYRYQYKNSPLGTGVFREAADPTMVLFHGTYLLFPSMSGGFWCSEDLAEWQYKATPELPIYDYAPDVREVNGGITFCASRRGENCGIYFSRDPLTEPFHQVSAPFPFWDPDIFQDDDGRVYLYWGCDTRTPIWGMELDRNTMTPVGEKKALVRENEKEHGWERVGENNVLEPPKTVGDRIIRLALGTKPCIEGSFMTKYRGKYYFQYATPGTEHNVYADGVYVGDSPLGPFRYQVHNPFAARPGGFITASGHGSTFQDKEGRWWHTSSMRISVNNNYERRVGLFPCAFDEDGILWCNQNFADYPMDLTRDAEDRMSPVPEWMLLSWRAKVTASSAQKGYEAGHASDESIRTWWAAMPSDRKASLQMDLGSVKSVKAIQVNFADHKLPLLPIPKKRDGEGEHRLSEDRDGKAEDRLCPGDLPGRRALDSGAGQPAGQRRLSPRPDPLPGPDGVPLPSPAGHGGAYGRRAGGVRSPGVRQREGAETSKGVQCAGLPERGDRYRPLLGSGRGGRRVQCPLWHCSGQTLPELAAVWPDRIEPEHDQQGTALLRGCGQLQRERRNPGGRGADKRKRKEAGHETGT